MYSRFFISKKILTKKERKLESTMLGSLKFYYMFNLGSGAELQGTWEAGLEDGRQNMTSWIQAFITPDGKRVHK